MKSKRGGESAADHAYFQDLEAAFIRLRGAPLLLSPADWQIAKQWRREGIPLELAVRVMERVFESQAQSKKKTGIRSLRYFRSAVTGAWHGILTLGGGEKEQPAEPIDVRERLARLAAGLPTRAELSEKRTFERDRGGEAFTDALDGIEEAVLALSGSVQGVEGELQRLDRSMMERLLAAVDARSLAALEESLQQGLEGLSQRMGTDVRDDTRRVLLRRRLRTELELPVLSLFSKEAIGDPEPSQGS